MAIIIICYLAYSIFYIIALTLVRIKIMSTERRITLTSGYSQYKALPLYLKVSKMVNLEKKSHHPVH